jgi:hypothetical protein
MPGVGRPCWTIACAAILAMPVVVGVPRPGETLQALPGTWRGDPTGFTYRWRRCEASGRTCSDVAGATGETLALFAADAGHTFRAIVTAVNAAGVRSASAHPTEPVL